MKATSIGRKKIKVVSSDPVVARSSACEEEVVDSDSQHDYVPPYQSDIEDEGSDEESVRSDDVHDAIDKCGTNTEAQVVAWTEVMNRDGVVTKSVAHNLARERKIQKRPSGFGKGKRKVSNTQQTNPKGVSINDRLNE